MKKIKFIFIVLFSLFILLTLSKVEYKADNGSAFRTYTVDSSKNLIPTQDAYIAVKTVTKINLTNSDNNSFKNPEDIYYNSKLKKFYIADTGNKRVVVLDQKLSSGMEVGNGILVKPQGVFTSDDGKIYVADYGLKAVAIFDPSDLDNPTLITKPTHPLYVESSSDFLPAKIAVDAVGTMYIIDSGNANGLVTITKDNEFAGYFGANYIQPDFKFVIKFLLSTKEQRKQLYVSPISPLNLAIDDDGLINTISAIKGSSVKKLNIAGLNLLPTDMIDWTSNIDICIGPTGTIYAVEKYGYICEYDREGNLLFDFGGYSTSGTLVGLFKNATSIEVDDDYSLYVLDGSEVQVFVQTEFASLVHEALDLYNDGKYSESRIPWQKVLELNNMFDLAHLGLGNAYLREGNYEEALSEFKLAKNTTSYSNAFWEVRNEWLNTYGYIGIVIIILLIIVIMILNKFHLFDKPKELLNKLKEKIFRVKFIKEVCYIKKFIRHPLDGLYEIKHQHTMGVGAATFWYGWFIVLTALGAYFTGFVFNPVDKETISVINILVESIVPLLLFVVANYLISSITDGSGKFRDVYIGSICSLAPVLLFMPFVIFFSNFVVESEAFFYTMPRLVLWGWSFILMFFMVKDIEELGIGENFKNVLLTILTMALFVAFAFLLYLLSKQFVSFIIDVVKEVISRV